jgi:hypothetical protein
MAKLKRPFRVEYTSHNFPNMHNRYSVHGDLEKARRTLKRALKNPGARQYCWRIHNIDTGETWQERPTVEIHPVTASTLTPFAPLPRHGVVIGGGCGLCESCLEDNGDCDNVGEYAEDAAGFEGLDDRF